MRTNIVVSVRAYVKIPKPSVPSARASAMKRTTLDSARAVTLTSEKATFCPGSQPVAMRLPVRTPLDDPNLLTTNVCDRGHDQCWLSVTTLHVLPTSLPTQHQHEVTPDLFCHREVGV